MATADRDRGSGSRAGHGLVRRRTFKQFKNADAPKLPIDMHELVAMVAPRAILAVENTGIDRLGSQAGSVSMKAATEVYKALGIPDRIGFTQARRVGALLVPRAGPRPPDVQAFVDKFLGGVASTRTRTSRRARTAPTSPSGSPGRRRRCSKPREVR